MPAYLALGVVVTLLVILFGRWFVATNPRDLARGLRWAAIGLAVALALLLAATEQFGLLLLLAAGGTLLAVSWRRRRGAPGGPGSPRATALLPMGLFHATGL